METTKYDKIKNTKFQVKRKKKICANLLLYRIQRPNEKQLAANVCINNNNNNNNIRLNGVGKYQKHKLAENKIYWSNNPGEMSFECNKISVRHVLSISLSRKYLI